MVLRHAPEHNLSCRECLKSETMQRMLGKSEQ